MKKHVLILVLAAALLAAGCGPSEERPDISQAYIGGNQGLVLSFAPGMPPNEVYDAGQEEFPIGIMIENVGESSIGVGTPNPFGFIEIIGISPTQFGKSSQDELMVTWSEADLTLSRAQRNFDGSIIPGETSLVDLPGFSYMSDRSGNAERTIRANVCYEYRTQAQAEICIKDNVLERAADDSICTLSGSKPISSSGAPVQVTQFTQNPAGADRIHVTFRIENVGPGAVFAPADGYAYAQQEQICDPSAGPNSARDRVNVAVSFSDEAYSDGYNIRCPRLQGGSFGTINMFGGSPVDLTCTLQTFGREGGRVFTDSLHIDLHYTYLDFIEKPILIRDTNIGTLDR